jgi:DNA polymerase III epsilon subunit-like protein
VNPAQPIPPESSGVHNITDIDVAEAPSVEEALAELAEFISGAGMVVAHNAAFDREFLTTIRQPAANARGEIEWDWLCTWRLARHLLPMAPNHKLATLRYLRKLDVPRDIAAHRALGDVIVTAALTLDLVHLYEERFADDADLDELLEYALSYITLPAWPFGKYFGRPIADAPANYIRWVLRNHDRAQRDRDLRKTLESELLRMSRRLTLAS